MHWHLNNYLGTPLTDYEYLRLDITLIPEDIIQTYNLLPLVINVFIYLDILKCVYGLNQVGRLAKHVLSKQLAPEGCFQFTHTPIIWQHKWHPMLLYLVVDDFDANYVGKEHSEHFI